MLSKSTLQPNPRHQPTPEPQSPNLQNEPKVNLGNFSPTLPLLLNPPFIIFRALFTSQNHPIPSIHTMLHHLDPGKKRRYSGGKRVVNGGQTGGIRVANASKSSSFRLHTLPFRELEPPTRTTLSVLLPFLHPRIACQKPRAAKHLLQRRIVPQQRTRQSQHDRTSLPRVTSATGPDENVHLPPRIRHLQRPENRLAVQLLREVVVQSSTIDLDLPRPRRNPHPCHRALTPPSAPHVRPRRCRNFRNRNRGSYRFGR